MLSRVFRLPNYPISLAPGMGINAFFAFTIGLGLITAALLALGTGQPKSLTIPAYLIALVFFLEFFRIFPFNG